MKIVGEIIPCDVDSTLVFDESDLGPGHGIEPVIAHCWGREIKVYPHWLNVSLLRKFSQRGYIPFVHSHSGEDWAEAVCKAVGLDDIPSIYARKSKYYIDDLPVEQWYGHRVYRDFKP